MISLGRRFHITFMISTGHWGGFYWNNGRLCLGWIAFTFMHYDVDDVLEAGLSALRSKSGDVRRGDDSKRSHLWN